MKRYDEEVSRCLFLKIQNRIISVMYDSTYIILTFDGEMSAEYNGDFWEGFKERAAYYSGQKVDYCFLSDSETWELPEWIKENRTDKTMWKLDKITEAVKKINLKGNVYITDRGVKHCIDRKINPYGEFWFIINNAVLNNYAETDVGKTDDEDMPIFARYFIKELQKDKERNKR